MSQAITRADRAVFAGLELVGIVRDLGPDTVTAFLRDRDRADLEALCVALAALVPDDKTAAELLAWCDPDMARREQARRIALLRAAQRPSREVLPHGSHARFNSHKKKGEEPCDLCVAGERLYQRNRSRRRRATATQEQMAS